MSRDETE